MSSDAWSALTPTSSDVTRLTEGANGVTVARVTSSSTATTWSVVCSEWSHHSPVNVPIGGTASVTEVATNVVFAYALSSVTITHWCSSLMVSGGARGVTLAWLAPHTLVHSTAPVASTAHLTSVPSRVVDTAETLTSHWVTVASAVQVNVAIALTLDTRSGGAMQTLGVTIVSIHTLHNHG